MSVGIWLVLHHEELVEAWLTEFDPDGGDLDYPTGSIGWDDDPAKALRFDSATEAMQLWRTVSSRTPTRPDGKPNRPLTAFTVAIKEVPE